MRDPYVDFLPYALLGLSLLSLWMTTRKKISLFGFGLALIAALLTHKLSGIGAIFITLFGYICYLLSAVRLSYAQKNGLKIAIAILGAALFIHTVPGFHNLKVIDNAKLDSESLPYSLYLNFDKTSVGFFLLWTLIPLARTRKEWKKALQTGALFGVFAAIALMVFSYLFRYVHISCKLPHFSVLYALTNLLSTCTAEEAFFRGFIQEELTKTINGKESRKLALIITSVLFGLGHYPGGAAYVVLATIAGLFYGVSYMLTKRIEASIFTHFIVNSIHFFFFSFPALSS